MNHFQSKDRSSWKKISERGGGLHQSWSDCVCSVELSRIQMGTNKWSQLPNCLKNLLKAQDAEICCHIGGKFLGADGFAEDVTLLASTHQVLQFNILDNNSSYGLKLLKL